MNSPKCKYCGQVNFLKPVVGIGSSVTFSSDSVEELKSFAAIYKNKKGSLKIMENKRKYPEFEWQCIETLNLNELK